DATPDFTGIVTTVTPTVFGCAVPTGYDPDGRAVISSADDIINAVGLVGLVAVRFRPKSRDDDG
ncbi:MAG: hypothetical protein ACPHK0_08065, partial [Dehalococcoidia bacterium]